MQLYKLMWVIKYITDKIEPCKRKIIIVILNVMDEQNLKNRNNNKISV